MTRTRRDPPPFSGIPMVHAANGHLHIRQHTIYHPFYSQMLTASTLNRESTEKRLGAGLAGVVR